MNFSRRTQWDLATTPWARHLERLRASGGEVLDLTRSNPTRCGFEFDPDLLSALAQPQALQYDPDPKGKLSARAAVAAYYAEHSAGIGPEDILLTASTSQAYSFLFRLLADPGDEILIAQPSYPLFDFLARIEDVTLRPYPLLYDHGWQIDMEMLKARIGAKTRAIIVVHPNNPTGHFTVAADREQLESLCRKHDLALIVDEVFLDYGLLPEARSPGRKREPRSFATGSHPALTFVLSGISKICGLPQMKVSWIACLGPKSARAAALGRLEVIADTFLPVSTSVECALPLWLDRRGGIERQILDRVRGNLNVLDEVLASQSPVNRLEVEGGWYVVLRIPALMSGEESALALLKARSIAIHAGEFFGFPQAGWLVASLLSPRDEFAAGARSLADYFNQLLKESR